MTARIAVLGAGVALLASGTAAAQEPEGAACERPPAADRSAVVGQVTDRETGLPLQQATVTLEWQAQGTRREKLDRKTDVEGRYAACDVAAGTPVRVHAAFGSANEREGITTGAGSTHTVDMRLDAPRSVVRGRVVESGSGRGISDAELSVEGSQVRTLTRTDGAFQLPALPPGTFRITTSHIGYGTRTDSVDIQYGAIMQYTIDLAVDPVALAPIDVDVRMVSLERVGFYDRRRTGFGAFLVRSSWEARGSILPSDIMRGVAGVRVVPGRGFGNIVVDRGNCRFRYFMDGAPVAATFEFDDIPTSWIEAIEVYRGVSQVPGEFRSSPSSARANCGVIVIWTRRPR
jgi:hypothetical protein